MVPATSLFLMAASSPGRSSRCFSFVCKPRILLVFGIPLFAPAIALTAIGFVGFPGFGIIHIGGLLLLTLSVICIVFGILIMVYTKPKEKKPVLEYHSQPDLPRINLTNVNESVTKINTKLQNKSKHKSTMKNPRPSRSPRMSKKLKTKIGQAGKERKRSRETLPTLTEDHEGERVRIFSAAVASHHISGENRTTNTYVTNDRNYKSVRLQDNDVMQIKCNSKNSDISLTSDSAIDIGTSPDLPEITHVEMINQTSCFLPLAPSPPNRSLSLTELFVPTEQIQSNRKRSDSMGNVLQSDLSLENLDGIAEGYPVTSSQRTGIRLDIPKLHDQAER
ncbi:uncharacterized protein LOC126811061 isoform X2 [Patella vulgata]|uniref:uncharacterized protein LOC126811061 isoform X2 n=1 Tax=Patella vulgata TaxID=6465 RepID=UPI00218042A1|nr:uncharacterized protein LOC126811061 isoform X2 [Patella vulgata]